MKSEHLHPNTHFSIFDTIEQVTINSQNFLSKCEKKVAKPLSKIFHQWERAISVILSERGAKEQELSELRDKYCASKNTELKLRVKLTHKKSKETEMIQEIQAIKDHLEEGKEMWAKQIKRIEEVMQEQERSKQKIESLYKQRLNEIDRELDDIMHIHKKKLGESQNLGEILPGLFSMEELMEEKRIALGEISKRELREVRILKLEGCSGEDICESNSEPDMNFEDLSGTQKLIFERLLELRKKVYKFKHDDTTCSERTSNANLPLELQSISHSSLHNPIKKLSQTIEASQKKDLSVLFCRSAGIVFGLNGSQKYRNGMTDLLKSDTLSVSQREKIVYDLINSSLSCKKKTVIPADLIKDSPPKQELPPADWGDVSSIHSKNAENVSDHVFSKASLSLSKVSLEKESLQPTESITDFQTLFDPNDAKKEPECSKDQEMSSMSILKDFSRVTTSTKRKLSEDSKKASDAEDVFSSRKFSIDQREPTGSLVIPPNMNLYFGIDPARPRSSPKVALKPEEGFRSRESSVEESFRSNKSRGNSESAKKPISMLDKLPIMPKPPSEGKKSQVSNFRGRSLQPVQPKSSSASPGRKINLGVGSTSPGAAIKFRMRRFKEGKVAGTKAKASGIKNLLPKRGNK